jgi:hypothetical protein
MNSGKTGYTPQANMTIYQSGSTFIPTVLPNKKSLLIAHLVECVRLVNASTPDTDHVLPTFDLEVSRAAG